MSRDRWIDFGEKHPTCEEVGVVLRGFFGAAGEVTWLPDAVPTQGEAGRWVVTLAGAPSWPFAGIADACQRKYEHDERWLEVVVSGTTVRVITREADRYTNCVADGFTNQLAEYWSGTVER